MNRQIILKYLLEGELDRLLSTPNPKLSKLMGEVIASYDALTAALSKEQVALADNYKDALDAYHAEEILHTITESFLAGMQFAFALKKD